MKILLASDPESELLVGEGEGQDNKWDGRIVATITIVDNLLLFMFTLTTSTGVIRIQRILHTRAIKTSGRCITYFAKMTIDSKFIELTAGVLIVTL